MSKFCFASFDFSENCKKAYTHIFNLNYEEAEYLIKVEKLYNPTNPAIIFLNSGIFFMKAVLEEDHEAIKLFYAHQEKLISELNKTRENEQKQNWLLAETYFHSALINFKTGNYLQGAWQLRKSYKIANKAADENNPLPFKITGLTEAFLSTVPDDYQWTLKIFGMNGDLTTGTNKLNKLLNISKDQKEYNFIFPELLFYTAYIEGNLLRNTKKALKLIEQYRNELTGPLGIYIYSSLLMKSGNNKKAVEILSEELKHLSTERYPFPYLIYMLGITKLQNLDLSSAEYFQKYINDYKGNHFIKAAHQKLAWILLLKNDVINYNKKLNDVIEKGTRETDEDKQAFHEALKKDMPEINLLKSRLLFDGGNYNDAEKILFSVNIKLLNEKNLVEYYYRLGRIKQEQAEEALAEINFLKAIKLQGAKEYYFAPNAALQMAAIYEENKNYRKAQEYYKKAYSYTKHEYKNSIQQKAKAGLKRIQNL